MIQQRSKVLLVLLGMVAVVLGVLTWVLVTSSLTIGLWLQRQALGTAGLQRLAVASEIGTQTVFEGGDPEAAPVVLLHGFGDQSATWSMVARQLIDRHHVLLVDLAGHGDSEPRGDELTFEEVYRALEAVVHERIPDEKVTLVGHSLGGWLALRYALDHPQRVRQLLLVNSAGLQHPLDEQILIPRDRAALDEKLRRTFPPDSVPHLAGFAQNQLVQLSSRPRYIALYRSLRPSDWLDDRLLRLATPAVLVWGTPDGFFPIEYARRLEAALPATQLIELEGCGHAPQVVCPEPLGELLTTLLTPEGGTLAPPHDDAKNREPSP